MSPSTCHFLPTVSLGGENLKTSARWRRNVGDAHAHAGSRGGAARGPKLARVCRFWSCRSRGTAHRAAVRATRTRTHVHAHTRCPRRLSGAERRVLPRFSSLPGQDAWLRPTSPTKCNERKLQKRGKTHDFSARQWSAGSRGSARSLAENSRTCAHPCGCARMRAHVCRPARYHRLSTVLRDAKERSQGDGLASRTRRNRKNTARWRNSLSRL